MARWRAKLALHPLAKLGSGLITGVADDDPSGIASYLRPCARRIGGLCNERSHWLEIGAGAHREGRSWLLCRHYCQRPGGTGGRRHVPAGNLVGSSGGELPTIRRDLVQGTPKFDFILASTKLESS